MKKILFLIAVCTIQYKIIFAQLSPAYGGENPNIPTESCLTNDERNAIKTELNANIQLLKQQGKLAVQNAKTEAVLFEFPMQFNDGFSDYGFYGISNFVDHNPTYPMQVLDYNCGNRTYDTDAGYNHKGIDFYLWPFSWNKMHNGEIKVVAAAPGTIIEKYDGNFDENCAFNPGSWNAVYIQHADGSTAWYGHMKNGSTTTKNIGDAVETGEYLGLIGSSGNSTGPHLHFEVYNNAGNLIDPNAGDCNAWNSESWWADQKPYYDAAVNRIQTNSAVPEFNYCPNDDVPNESDVFNAGDGIYFFTYFKDQRSTDLCQYQIIAPDNSVFAAWDFSMPYPYFSSSYWYWYYTIPVTALNGTWKFQIDFAGQTYVHEFEINNGVSSIQDDKGIIKIQNIYYNNKNLYVTLNANSAGTTEFFLNEITGKKTALGSNLISAGSNQFKWNIGDKSSGIYLLTVQSSEYPVFKSYKFFIY